MKRITCVLALTAMALLTLTPSPHVVAQTETAYSMTEGEVRRIDKDANKLTLRHGPIENLGMPPMTMVFQVKYPALLDKVKVGDKVKFRAEKISGVYAVTHVEAVQ